MLVAAMAAGTTAEGRSRTFACESGSWSAAWDGAVSVAASVDRKWPALAIATHPGRARRLGARDSG